MKELKKKEKLDMEGIRIVIILLIFFLMIHKYDKI